MKKKSKGVKFTSGTTSRLIADTLEARGVRVVYDRVTRNKGGVLVPRRIAKFNISGVDFVIRGPQIYFASGDKVVSGIDGVAIRLFKQKDVVKSLLRARGFPVPEGHTFSSDQMALARIYFREVAKTFPGGVCIKPVDGNMGRDVFVGVKELDDFEPAFDHVGALHGRVMVEEAVAGDVYRFTVVDGEVLAVRFGRPQNVKGDGVSKIAELVGEKVKARKSHPVYKTHPFPFGDEQVEFLRKQGFSEQSVPEDGRIVYLGSRSNSHAGADVIECMDQMHPSYVEMVSAAVSSMPDIVVCGADLMIQDRFLPASDKNCSFIELNTGPGFAASSKPWEGAERDVAGPLVDYLFRIAEEKA